MSTLLEQNEQLSQLLQEAEVFTSGGSQISVETDDLITLALRLEEAVQEGDGDLAQAAREMAARLRNKHECLMRYLGHY